MKNNNGFYVAMIFLIITGLYLGKEWLVYVGLGIFLLPIILVITIFFIIATIIIFGEIIK